MIRAQPFRARARVDRRNAIAAVAAELPRPPEIAGSLRSVTLAEPQRLRLGDANTGALAIYPTGRFSGETNTSKLVGDAGVRCSTMRGGAPRTKHTYCASTVYGATTSGKGLDMKRQFSESARSRRSSRNRTVRESERNRFDRRQ